MTASKVPGGELTLAARLATAPGLIREGISTWDGTIKLPLQPPSLEIAYTDMRDVAHAVCPAATTLPTEAISSYLGILEVAADLAVLGRRTYQLAVDAIVEQWAQDHARWTLLSRAAS